MEQKKQAALNAIRQLIAYHSTFLREGNGYTGDGPLTYITKEKALVALRYCPSASVTAIVIIMVLEKATMATSPFGMQECWSGASPR